MMNSLIYEKHSTFFHRNCSGGNRTRLLMDGVVEIAWYCPSGKQTDTFDDCVAFCNLHGDAAANEKQYEILTSTASVNVLFLPDFRQKNHYKDDGIPWKEYRTGGPEYASWSITPDLSELPYWKWFACRFQTELEKLYEKTFQGSGKIPREWRKYSQEDAIEGLDKYI
ncbi:hypothetical protein cypCar_00043909 [Cyprinus carpio]|nr:hypothetical protein cypCar_00043909 [Cyprinus carpio]